MEEKKVACRIPVEWGYIQEVANRVRDVFDPGNEDIAVKCMIASSELLENAVRYCSGDIGFNFSVGHDSITIEVSSGISAAEDIRLLTEYIDIINTCANPKELYINSLLELTHDDHFAKRPHLGLLRVAGEGDFKLRYTFDRDTLLITGTMSY